MPPDLQITMHMFMQGKHSPSKVAPTLIGLLHTYAPDLIFGRPNLKNFYGT